MTHHIFTATVSRGAEEALCLELNALGIQHLEPDVAAVRFRGTLADGYRACLWSRVASRVLIQLSRFGAPDEGALYDGVRRIAWREHLAPGATIAVDFVGGNDQLRNSQFSARRVKDAVCDYLRDATGRRPDVDLRTPDLRIHVHLRGDIATLSLDLSGDALHLRGVGRATGKAPIKETLAAAILWFAQWPQLAAEGRPLLDPLCGSGTFLTEGASIAADLAPGLHRPRWGFQGWVGHQPELWRTALGEAKERSRAPRRLPPIIGYDHAESALQSASSNLRALGLERDVRLYQAELSRAVPPPGPPGILVCNPPYGVRIAEVDDLRPLYTELGDRLRREFMGWTGYVITGSRDLAGCIGLRPKRRVPLYNGAIECRLLSYPIADRAPEKEAGPGWR